MAEDEVTKFSLQEPSIETRKYIKFLSKEENIVSNTERCPDKLLFALRQVGLQVQIIAGDPDNSVLVSQGEDESLVSREYTPTDLLKMIQDLIIAFDEIDEGLIKSKDYIKNLNLGSLNNTQEWPPELITALSLANTGVIFADKKKKVGKATLLEQVEGKFTPQKIGEKEMTQREAAGYLKRLWEETEVESTASVATVPAEKVLQEKPNEEQVRVGKEADRRTVEGMGDVRKKPVDRLTSLERQYIGKVEFNQLNVEERCPDILYNALKKFGEVNFEDENQRTGKITLAREDRRGGKRVITLGNQKQAVHYLRQVLHPATNAHKSSPKKEKGSST